MKSVGICTLGCKVNAYESEYIQNQLKKEGYIIKSFNDNCDVYIINTCTVTNNSDSKSRKMIHQAIRKNPNACVVVMGCFIESHKDYLEDGIDIIIGNKDKSKVVSYINDYLKNKERIIKLYSKRHDEFEEMEIENDSSHTRAFVKIQDGCDNFCSYCIIPFVRGKCRSKKEEAVIKEISNLVNNNYKEIVLTGIHTGNYGADLETSFTDLLRKIVQIKGLMRVRISSIECTELNQEVLKVLKESNIIVNHLHIPLQAGSDEILKTMNRKYTLAEYENKINEIRAIRKNIAISTDVIVGFPGETEELFKKTIETCKKIAFSKIHVFPYSERTGTASSRMKNKIDQQTKKQRTKELMNLSKELEINYMNQFLNQEVEVLIEENDKGYSTGHTSNYLHVKVKGELPSNEMIKIKLEKVEYPYIIGTKKGK